MQAIRQFSREKLPLVLGIFIVFQPVLDILTALSIRFALPVTAGVVVRALFMALAVLYVIFVSDFPGKKWCLAALGALVAYLAAFMIHLLVIGGLGLCLANVQEVVKTFFAPFVAVFLYAAYKESGSYVSTRAIAWAGGIYVGVILLAFLTGTSNKSYGNSGFGENGWFYAANEISCIVAITAPILLYYCLQTLPEVRKKTWWKGVLIVWSLAAVVFTAECLGTKAVFAAVLLYVAAALFWLLIRQRQKPSRQNIVRLISVAAVFVVIIGTYSSSALQSYLTNVYNPILDVPSDDVPYLWSTPKPSDDPDPSASLSLEDALNEATDGTWLRLLIRDNALVQRMDQILSRRLFTASPSVQTFLDGGPGVKLLGVGYANTPAYDRNVEFMIEMDPLAILIRHGVVGFLLCVVPYLVFLAVVLVRFFQHPLKRMSSLKYCSYLYSCLLAFAISLVVGHAMVSPAVSIFLLVTAEQLWIVSGQEDPEALPAA